MITLNYYRHHLIIANVKIVIIFRTRKDKAQVLLLFVSHSRCRLRHVSQCSLYLEVMPSTHDQQ